MPLRCHMLANICSDENVITNLSRTPQGCIAVCHYLRGTDMWTEKCEVVKLWPILKEPWS